MAQIFHPSMNTLARASIFGAVFLLGGLGWVGHTIDKSAYNTEAGVAKDQPVPFSHEHHVKGLGIDCRYCHTSVEHSSFAGIPPTKTCMTCHSQIWTNAEVLRPVEQIYNMDYRVDRDSGRPEKTQAALGAKLVEEYRIRKGQLTNCSVCHR